MTGNYDRPDSNSQYQENENREGLLGRSNIKGYLSVGLGMILIVVLYHLATGVRLSPGLPSGQPRDGFPGNPPDGGNPPGNMLNPGGLMDVWPLWGQLVLPSLFGFLLGLGIVFLAAVTIWYVYEKLNLNPRWFLVTLFGFLIIVATNLIHGWTDGIYNAIGATSEIFQDAVLITNPLDFIANYETLQSSLSLHAQTQPPGAVLFIYLLYLILGSPDLIALGLCAIATFGSAFFIDRIMAKRFDSETARYGVLLFVLLPAIQVYYLANIYAIVATIMSGLFYFYEHSNNYVSFIGSSIFAFLGTFMSFLFVYAFIFLFLYELVRSGSPRSSDVISWLKRSLRNISKITIIGVIVAGLYGLLYVTLGFNYIGTFLYASALENPSGFMLFADPGNYVITRLQNVLDIAVFFGPVLIVLLWRGMKTLKEHYVESYQLVMSAMVALLLFFLTGAPKKGETARICLFILPFLLIPVLAYVKDGNLSRREIVLLALAVFVQAVIMQLFGSYIW